MAKATEKDNALKLYKDLKRAADDWTVRVQQIETALSALKNNKPQDVTMVLLLQQELAIAKEQKNNYQKQASSAYKSYKNVSKSGSSKVKTVFVSGIANSYAMQDEAKRIAVKKNRLKSIQNAAAAVEEKRGIQIEDIKGVSWVTFKWDVNQSFKLPVSPQEVEIKTAATFAKHSIIGLGEIQIPNGSEQTTISWEGILPLSHQDVGYVITKNDFQPPDFVIKKMEYFRQNQTLVTLTIPGLISQIVQLSSFTFKKAGKGDFSYSIEWIESEASKIESSIKSGANSGGGGRASKGKKNPYPAKKGQTLYSLAKKIYGSGSKWKTLYSKNKKALKKAGLGKKKTAKLKKNMKLKW